MDTRRLYLNKWNPDFDPELDVPNVVSVWVWLPHLPLHCWGDDFVRAIGNAVGKFIDRSEPKDNMQACTKICVEVDLGKGIPEVIKIKVDNWTHIQQLNYEKIPFKGKVCHEYGHFANRCSKVIDIENSDLETQWETTKKRLLRTLETLVILQRNLYLSPKNPFPTLPFLLSNPLTPPPSISTPFPPLPPLIPSPPLPS